MLNKLTVFLGVIGLLGFFWFQYSFVKAAYQAGFNECKLQYQNETLNLQIQAINKERAFNEKIEALSLDLAQVRANYENTLNNLKSSYAAELLKSQQRAELYKRYSESDKAKQRALALHTAQLDRSLTEGRELVKQLTETLRIRDAQLRALGVYFQENTMLYE